MGDEQAETMRAWREVSRTDWINPVAIFDPVELEGTTVKIAPATTRQHCQRAKLGIGDRLQSIRQT